MDGVCDAHNETNDNHGCHKYSLRVRASLLKVVLSLIDFYSAFVVPGFGLMITTVIC